VSKVSEVTRDVNTTPEETQRRVSEKIVKRGKSAVEKKNRILQRLRVEYVAIDQVKPNPYNPNRQDEHDFELLCRSMEEDGFTQPIIVNRDSVIVDGEHRWRAAKTLGFTEIPIVRVDMSPEQMRISTLRHNRARGSEDIELTAQVLRDLQELGALDWAQDSLMLDDTELNRLMEDISAPEALAAEQFGESWEPSNPHDGVEAKVTDREGQQDVSAASADASDRVRRREAMLKAAKTDEERQMALKDTAQVRLYLTFSIEQGQLVKQVLGARPAERLYEICRSMDSQP